MAGELGPRSINKAREILNYHGLGIDCIPASGLSDPDIRFDWSGQASTYELDDLAKRIRARGYPVPRIHVVFLHLTDKRDYGETKSTQGICFIDADGVAPDSVTVLHEIGHAVGCPHEASAAGARYRSVMSYAANRNRFQRSDILRFLASPYVQ